MTHSPLSARVARSLAATALLAMITGCATGEKPAYATASSTSKDGPYESNINLNAPGPHQTLIVVTVKDDHTATFSVPVVTTGDDLVANGHGTRKKHLKKMTVKIVPDSDPHNIVVTPTVEETK